MKIRMNYVSPVRRYALVLSVVLSIGSLLLVTLTIQTWLHADRAAAALPGLKEQTRRMTEIATTAQKTQLPPRKDMDHLRNLLRTRIPHRDATRRPIGLLQQLELLLPGGAELKSLRYDIDKLEVSLTIQSSTVQALNDFLVSIENSEQFSEVVLRKQSQSKQQGRLVTQFDISLKVRA